MLDGDKKIMATTLDFYVVVNKIYLYNYNDKIIVLLIMSYKKKLYKIYQNSIIPYKNKNQIKILKNYQMCLRNN